MVLGRTRIGGLAPQRGQRGPVERPGLRDRLLLDVAGKFVKPIDQGLVDRRTRPFDRDDLRPGLANLGVAAP